MKTLDDHFSVVFSSSVLYFAFSVLFSIESVCPHRRQTFLEQEFPEAQTGDFVDEYKKHFQQLARIMLLPV
jgi:hypothetical protein